MHATYWGISVYGIFNGLQINVFSPIKNNLKDCFYYFLKRNTFLKPYFSSTCVPSTITSTQLSPACQYSCGGMHFIQKQFSFTQKIINIRNQVVPQWECCWSHYIFTLHLDLIYNRTYIAQYSFVMYIL